MLRQWVTPIAASVVLLVLTTAVLWVVEAHVKQDHLIFIYFVPTALIAIRYGSISATGVTIAGAFAAAYLLYAPRYSFAIARPLDLLELTLFSLLALLASQVVSGFAGDRGIVRRRATSLRAKWPSSSALRKRNGSNRA